MKYRLYTPNTTPIEAFIVLKNFICLRMTCGLDNFGGNKYLSKLY